ncbi:hypothetical protein K7432_006061 [Basidiobolus ranarum]|uniref:Uncharacterized protein n=1 Tax=Basidiobolus ranarum TaxID=34480 RepID=A0ABR2W293_9FUNG
MSSTIELVVSHCEEKFHLVEEAYEEVFELYTEGLSNDKWTHNQFAQPKLDEIEVELEIDNKTVTLNFLQNPTIQTSKGITGAIIWDSSICLSNFLCKNSDWLGLRKGKYCLELGSGCGLTGLTCYHLGSSIHFTDQEVMLKYLEKNVKTNTNKQVKEKLPKHRREEVYTPEVELSELMWGEKLPKEISEQHIDCVLASDCVYNEYIVPKLISTFKDISTPKTLFIIAQELRSDSVHLLFLEELLQDFIVYRAVQQGKFASSCVVIYLAWRKDEE